MSAFLFHSSPPRSSQLHYQTSATSFFTPQVHGSRILGWPQSFTPTLPSSPPSAQSTLFTSKNANIMRSPSKSTKQVRFEDEYENEDTSMQMQDDSSSLLPSLHTPFTRSTVNGISGQQVHENQQATSNTDKAPFSQQTSIFQPTLQIHENNGTTPFDESNVQSHPRNRFQQRSRDLSSSSLLSNSIANARSTRQSGSRFLDRLRQTRHDRRDRRGAETMEQIDFFDERRKREAWFEREAPDVDLDADLDEYFDEQQILQQIEEEGMSPTEEKEVEELVRSYYESEGGSYGRGLNIDMGTAMDSTQVGRNEDLWREDEESEYDQLFMELLSQEQISSAGANMSPGISNDLIGGDHGAAASDRDTEMS